jgi:hypothetical protein
MKAIILAALLVLSVGCGQASGRPSAAVASPSASPVTTPAGSPTSGQTASGGAHSSPGSAATPKTSATLLFAVLEAKGTANAWTYNTIAIVGLDGVARAKTTFTPMPTPDLGCIGAVLSPSAHVAAGKVYFADGNGVIRSLGIDGKVATVATFPLTSSQQMLSFAVNPDGSRLLGTVLTTPKNAYPCTGSPAAGAYAFDMYAASNGGASTLMYHLSWTQPQNVLALTGWDAASPVGTYPTVWASQGGGPGSTLGVYVRVDPATGKPGSQIADPSKCQIWDTTGSGAFVCLGDSVVKNGGTPQQTVDAPVSVRRVDGSELWHFTASGQNSPFGLLLAPDGQHVMFCCNDLDLADAHERLVARDGKQVDLAKGFGASGWLDSTTMVGWVGSGSAGPAPMAYVALNSPGVVVSMGFTGLFVGAVRA